MPFKLKAEKKYYKCYEIHLKSYKQMRREIKTLNRVKEVGEERKKKYWIRKKNTCTQDERNYDDDEEVAVLCISISVFRIRKIELVINHFVLDLAHHGNISSGNDDTSGS